MSDFIDSLAGNAAVSGLAFAIGAALIGLWLAAAWWTYADMARRSNAELARFSAAAWIILSTPALLPLALASYALMRPQQTVAERRSKRLFEALAPTLMDAPTCFDCRAPIDLDWRRCPSCTTWLQSACVACGRWSSRLETLCPWCAADRVPEVQWSQAPAWQPVPAQMAPSAALDAVRAFDEIEDAEEPPLEPLAPPADLRSREEVVLATEPLRGPQAAPSLAATGALGAAIASRAVFRGRRADGQPPTGRDLQRGPARLGIGWRNRRARDARRAASGSDRTAGPGSAR
jgi:hypothetical protein